MTDLILLSLIGGSFSLFGGMILLWQTKLANKLILPLIAFGAGAFLAAAYLDILPEALEMANSPDQVMLAVLTGFVGFFLLERFLMKFTKTAHGAAGHSDHTETLPALLVLGDSLHNFLDGVLIGMAYLVSPAAGISTAFAVAAHEVPQEIGDFSILLSLGWSRSKVISVNIFQSLITIPGALIGYYLGQQLSVSLSLMLGAAAGVFIYIAASDLIPELHHRSQHKHFFRIILPLLTGVFAVQFLSRLTGR